MEFNSLNDVLTKLQVWNGLTRIGGFNPDLVEFNEIIKF